MSETRAMTTRNLTPDVWHMIEAVAPVIHKSRLFGVTSPEAAAAIALKGYELGFGIAASFEFIVVIQGKPALIPRGALALVLQSGLLEGMEIKDEPNACTVWMKRKSGIEYRLTYTMEQARKAGLVKPNSAWESYGPNMLRWRCTGFVIDVLFPDVCGGLKRADEFGAEVDAEGNIVDGTWTPAAAPAQPEPPVVSTVVTLDDLLGQYSPEQIMEANEGKIPATDEEVAAVAEKLAGGNG